MTYSMTGFARKELAAPWGTLVCEMRSVNQRYLESYFRLPDTFRVFEIPLRDLLRSKLKRGKVEVSVRFTPIVKAGDQFSLNENLVTNLANACATISEKIVEAGPVDPLKILQWPGVLEEDALDMDEVKTQLLVLAQDCLKEMIAHRKREGDELAKNIEERLVAIAEVVSIVRNKMPEIITQQKQNLVDRIAELNAELEPQRLEAEVALLAQKADVAEELDRLDTHIQETRHILKQKGAIGRRLDFLMQEFNREANTLSSKSVVSETTGHAVDLKVYIEQMREQVQNIE